MTEPGTREGTAALHDVIAERERQKAEEGWTLEHDDKHDCEEMRFAAACYCLGATELEIEFAYGSPNRGGTLNTVRGHASRGLWPWDREWWKPHKTRRNLVKAAALLLAEIERIDRAEAARSVLSTEGR